MGKFAENLNLGKRALHRQNESRDCLLPPLDIFQGKRKYLPLINNEDNEFPHTKAEIFGSLS